MLNQFAGIVTTLLTIYLIPIIVYGAFAKFWGVQPPAAVSPARFLTSILVAKIGTAIAMTLLYSYARAAFAPAWWLYALLWWGMFVFGEIGQWLEGKYTAKEAVAGIISETIYIPLAVFILTLLMS